MHSWFAFYWSLTFQFEFISSESENGEAAKMKSPFVKRFFNFWATSRELDKEKMSISMYVRITL